MKVLCPRQGHLAAVGVEQGQRSRVRDSSSEPAPAGDRGGEHIADDVVLSVEVEPHVSERAITPDRDVRRRTRAMSAGQRHVFVDARRVSTAALDCEIADRSADPRGRVDDMRRLRLRQGRWRNAKQGERKGNAVYHDWFGVLLADVQLSP